MKARLNLTIDNNVLEGIKAHASGSHISISELVENYFKSITQPAKRENLLDLVDKLPHPKADTAGNLKDRYYKKFDIMIHD